MVRTEEVSKKKKIASTDGSKPKKELEKPIKDKSADKKKSDTSSSKAGAHNAKDSSKDKPKLKEVETKSKAASKQPSARITKPKATDDYLGDFDLPSSSEEEEEEEVNGHQPLYIGEKKEQELKPAVRITGSTKATRSRRTGAATQPSGEGAYSYIEDS